VQSKAPHFFTMKKAFPHGCLGMSKDGHAIFAMKMGVLQENYSQIEDAGLSNDEARDSLLPRARMLLHGVLRSLLVCTQAAAVHFFRDSSSCTEESDVWTYGRRADREAPRARVRVLLQ
jgi:hypothetical protein